MTCRRVLVSLLLLLGSLAAQPAPVGPGDEERGRFPCAVLPRGAPTDPAVYSGAPLLIEAVASPPSDADRERVRELSKALAATRVAWGLVVVVRNGGGDALEDEARDFAARWIGDPDLPAARVYLGWPGGLGAGPPRVGTRLLFDAAGREVGRARTAAERAALAERLVVEDARAREGLGATPRVRAIRRQALLQGAFGRARRLLETRPPTATDPTNAALLAELRTAFRARLRGVRECLAAGEIATARTWSEVLLSGVRGWPAMEDAAAELARRVARSERPGDAPFVHRLERLLAALRVEGPSQRILERLRALAVEEEVGDAVTGRRDAWVRRVERALELGRGREVRRR